jgi:arginyl-tRNA synthetase
MDFDLELAKEESERNPVYYVQYGHARISSLLELAREKGYPIDLKENLSALKEKEEWNLIKKIPEFTETLEDAARIRESHLLTHYLLNISKLYHNFYQNIRILDGNKDLIPPRLFLSNAVRNVIKKGLKLLGVSAPERM